MPVLGIQAASAPPKNNVLSFPGQPKNVVQFPGSQAGPAPGSSVPLRSVPLKAVPSPPPPPPPSAIQAAAQAATQAGRFGKLARMAGPAGKGFGALARSPVGKALGPISYGLQALGIVGNLSRSIPENIQGWRDYFAQRNRSIEPAAAGINPLGAKPQWQGQPTEYGMWKGKIRAKYRREDGTTGENIFEFRKEGKVVGAFSATLRSYDGTTGIYAPSWGTYLGLLRGSGSNPYPPHLGFYPYRVWFWGLGSSSQYPNFLVTNTELIELQDAGGNPAPLPEAQRAPAPAPRALPNPTPLPTPGIIPSSLPGMAEPAAVPVSSPGRSPANNPVNRPATLPQSMPGTAPLPSPGIAPTPIPSPAPLPRPSPSPGIAPTPSPSPSTAPQRFPNTSPSPGTAPSPGTSPSPGTAPQTLEGNIADIANRLSGLESLIPLVQGALAPRQASNPERPCQDAPDPCQGWMGGLLEELLNRIPEPEPEPEPGTEEPAPEPEPEPAPEVPNWVGEFPWTGEIFDSDISRQGAQSEQRQIANIAEGLKVLLERVEVISKILGIDEYPIPAPESILEEEGQEIGQTAITNAAAFQAWQFGRFDELMGQWEIPLKIKDADPTVEGDQPEFIKLPNLAEAIAELFGLTVQSAINSETLLNLSIKALAETGQNKQQGFRTYKLIEALSDWFGVEFEEKKFNLPLSFTPGANKIDQFVKAKQQPTTGHVYKNKDTFKDNLHDLLHGAAIIRAAFWRKLDQNGDLKQQIMDNVRQRVNVNEEISKDKDDDFDRYLEDVELGWTNQVGISDSMNPYGRPYSRRPKIREIGQDTSDVEGQ